MAPKDIGKFFIVSFEEDFPADETLYFIQDHRIAGVILFGNHCGDPDLVRDWLGDFKKSLDYPLIVAIDQEGGRVRRFRRGFPELDAPRVYGDRHDSDRYRYDLERMCERLYEIGVNMNLVPTVDLFDAEPAHVLDGRTFSNDPRLVAEFARITIDVHHRHGLLTCAKHFPGLGRSVNDPHHRLAVTTAGEDEFFELEMVPFVEAIGDGVDGVMVTHLTAPKVDDKPVLLSEKIIGGWLKERLAFNGPVLTDDLLMDGAAEIGALPNLAWRSFMAGADILLFGQNIKKATDAYNMFVERYNQGEIGADRLADASARIERLRRGL